MKIRKNEEMLKRRFQNYTIATQKIVTVTCSDWEKIVTENEMPISAKSSKPSISTPFLFVMVSRSS